jgi:hypothetical protein
MTRRPMPIVACVVTGFCAVLIYAFLARTGSTARAQSSPVADQKIIRAQRLEIVDDRGSKRIGISVTSGRAGVDILDDRGTKRIGISVIDMNALADGGRAGFALYDKAGNIRASLSVAEDGQTVLSLCDNGSAPRLQMVVDANGEGRIWSPQGNPASEVPKGPAADLSNWRKLRIGMSGAEVEAVLGKAQQSRTVAEDAKGNQMVLENWGYPSGSVQFNNGRVTTWHEPAQR